MVVAALPVFLVGSVLLAVPLFPEPYGAFSGNATTQNLAMLAGGGGLALFGILMGTLGLGLYVLIPAFSGRDRALRDYGSHRVVLACTALAIIMGNVLALLYFIPLSFQGEPARRVIMGEMLSPSGLAVAALALDVALLGVVYLRVVRPAAISWGRMGLERDGLARRVLLGLLLGLVLLGASTMLEQLMQRLGVQQTQTELFGSVRGAGLPEFLLVLIPGAVIAPVVEEIYFRGYVFRAYLDQKGVTSAFLFSAGLFALVHLNLAAFVPIFGMGLLLCLFYYRTNSIVPGIVAHAINNAAAFILLYLGLQ